MRRSEAGGASRLGPGSRLGPYEVVSPLGSGGMGEVYLALDTRLGRHVAVKVLPSELSADRERLARLEREARTASALNHPNIVTVYDIGSSGSTSYIAMEFVEGKTLREVLLSGPLPAKRAIEIASQAANGLAKAHAAGIVHRDLKPENLMISKDGFVKILDFGLAKVAPWEGGELSRTPTVTLAQTEEGTVLGTVGYMSPEQARAEAVDFRSDQFSFGAIFYEMVAGKRPFEGTAAADVMAAIIRDQPEPLTAAAPKLSAPAGWIIERCLAKDAAERYASTRDLALDLATLRDRISETPAPSDSGSVRTEEGFWIAVLAFQARGGDPAVEALAEGLTEDIRTGLSRFSYLRVIARSSTAQLTGQAVDAREAGKALGARYVMEGSLRQAGTKLRLAVQLIDSATGAHLWAENYERDFSPESVFELQDDLVPRIVSTIADMHGILTQSMSEALRSRPPEQLSPYEAVLRSFAYSGRRPTAEELAAARFGLELAVRKAPAYADAWAMLAFLCVQDYAQGFNLQADSLASGLAFAQRAVEAGPSNHLAHTSLAQALFFRKEFERFRNAAERAVALNPNDGASIAYLGGLVTYAGDSERGLALTKRAKQLNPNHPGWYWYADFYDSFRQGDYRGALGFALKVDLPGHWFAHATVAAARGQLGERDAAGKAVGDLLQLRPAFATTAGADLAKWWEPEFAERVIEGLRKAGLDVPAPSGAEPAAKPVERKTGRA